MVKYSSQGLEYSAPQPLRPEQCDADDPLRQGGNDGQQPAFRFYTAILGVGIFVKQADAEWAG